MTTIYLKGEGGGLSDWGYKSRDEMIIQIREHAQWEKDKAEKILSAKDEDFIVEQHLNVHTRKNIVRI